MSTPDLTPVLMPYNTHLDQNHFLMMEIVTWNIPLSNGKTENSLLGVWFWGSVSHFRSRPFVTGSYIKNNFIYEIVFNIYNLHFYQSEFNFQLTTKMHTPWHSPVAWPPSVYIYLTLSLCLPHNHTHVCTHNLAIPLFPLSLSNPHPHQLASKDISRKKKKKKEFRPAQYFNL